jgi:hypothetical protein
VAFSLARKIFKRHRTFTGPEIYALARTMSWITTAWMTNQARKASTMSGRHQFASALALFYGAALSVLSAPPAKADATQENVCLLDTNGNGNADPGDTAGGATTSLQGGFACGPSSYAIADNASAIGENARAYDFDATAIGASSAATQSGSTATGAYSTASGLMGTSDGYASIAAGTGDIAIGARATTVNTAYETDGNIAIGKRRLRHCHRSGRAGRRGESDWHWNHRFRLRRMGDGLR